MGDRWETSGKFVAVAYDAAVDTVDWHIEEV